MAAAAVLIAAIARQIAETAAPAVLIGYSGGLDSSVLLACAAAAARAGGVPIRALHVHHGLLPQADGWAEHAALQAQRLEVPISIVHVEVDPRGQGLEAAARKARHAAFEARMTPGSLLLLAHHQQDQAETVLMRLLRGAALDGVAGMRPLRTFGSGWLGRPWLDLPRSEILAAAQALGVSWVEDPSNADPQLDRAWLRQSIWPVLSERFPEAGPRLARFATHARAAQDVVDSQAAQALERVRTGRGSLSIAALLRLPEGLIGEVLRLHAIERGAPPPGFHELARIRREVIGARVDAEPCLRWQRHEYRRYRDDLYLLAPGAADPPPPLSIEWPAQTTVCALPHGLGRLEAVEADGSPAPLPIALTVRWRRGGEQLRPQGKSHRRELRLLFQEQAVPPWRRQRIPLVYVGKELIEVPGLARADAPELGGLRLRWVELDA